MDPLVFSMVCQHKALTVSPTGSLPYDHPPTIGYKEGEARDGNSLLQFKLSTQSSLKDTVFKE